MVPSSSADFTRAMRGQAKRLSRIEVPEKKWGGGNVIVYVLILFHSRDVCPLSRLFVRTGFGLFCARLALRYLAVYSALGSSIN